MWSSRRKLRSETDRTCSHDLGQLTFVFRLKWTEQHIHLWQCVDKQSISSGHRALGEY